ncbi:MAG: YicC/YloC family endoribonuclease [Terriglobales bacterium]
MTAIVYSMTGFAQATQAQQDCSVAVSLRSVNHRFLDLRWQLPPELEPALADMEKQVRAALARGHLDIRCHCETRSASAGTRLDESALNAYLAVWSELQRRLGPKRGAAAPPISDVLRAPGVLATSALVPVATETWAALAHAALAAALTDLRRMRAAEGAALTLDLTARLDRIDAARATLESLRLELETGLRARLQLRMREVLGAAAPNPDRLLQEAALQADRSDISEELTRLKAHVAQARTLLAAGGEVGKRLDFLTQELHREVNTLLSKSSSASAAGLQVSQIGLDLKAELEKFREQVQNLE